jgi:hypothetical protein
VSAWPIEKNAAAMMDALAYAERSGAPFALGYNTAGQRFAYLVMRFYEDHRQPVQEKP